MPMFNMKSTWSCVWLSVIGYLRCTWPQVSLPQVLSETLQIIIMPDIRMWICVNKRKVSASSLNNIRFAELSNQVAFLVNRSSGNSAQTCNWVNSWSSRVCLGDIMWLQVWLLIGASCGGQKQDTCGQDTRDIHIWIRVWGQETKLRFVSLWTSFLDLSALFIYSESSLPNESY